MNRTFHLYLYGPDGDALATTFDEVAERIGQLNRLHCEPDGSFYWTPTANESIFGMIYDVAGGVQYFELRGECELETWRTLVTAIGGTHDERMVVMCLQKRQLQEIQSFERTCWKST